MKNPDEARLSAEERSPRLADFEPLTRAVPRLQPQLHGGRDAIGQRRSGPSSAVWVMTASIIGAGAVMSSLIYADRQNGRQTSEQPPSGISAIGSVSISSPNCKSWINARQQIEAIPNLPTGWNWDMPNIDIYISNRNNALAKSLDLLESDIMKRPPDTAADATGQYIAAWRSTMQRMSERTSSAIDDDVLTATYKALNSACGLG